MRKILTKDILECMIHDYHNGLGLVELSNKYGFQERTIQKHFHSINIEIKKGNAIRFSEEELSSIISDYKNGMKPYELSKKYNRNSGTIISKLQDIGVYKFATHRFTNEEIEFLKVYYPLGDWDTIKNKMPNISRQSIQTKMSSIGISMNSHYWSKEDEQILIDNYESMFGCVNSLVELFNGKFTYKSIVSKARKLGLKTRELWTNDEINILLDNYGNKTLDEMLKLLPNGKRNSIINKARSLKLKNKSILDCQFNESEKSFIFENYNKMTDKEISIKLNRKVHSITDFRHRNGLLKSYEKSSYNDLSEYVRRNNLEWKTESMKNCEYKCVLTGERFDDIHHIYGLNLILNETMYNLNIEVKENMDDYTSEELRNILDTFRNIQSTYPLGVCLSKPVHSLFHSIYGYGDNTQEQWNEFVKDFKKGKFTKILNVA